MKKNISLVLIVSVVLLAAALIMMGTVGLNGKLTTGGGAVCINVGATYDAETVKGYVEAAGFKSPVILEGSKTAIEIETASMSEESLDAAAQALLASVQADYAEATIAYSDTFGAPHGVHHFRSLAAALAALAVVGYLYGALRYGWKKGLAPVLTALVAAVVTGSVFALISGICPVGMPLVGIVAGTACLTYVYSVAIYGKMKADAEYTVRKSDKAVPVYVIVAVVLLTVATGAVQTLADAVVGCVVAAACMYCVAPMFWKACTK